MLPDQEEIPDEDAVSRLVDYPHKYRPELDLIWDCVFEFPGRDCESLVWRKHASTDDEVHKIGAGREAEKQQTRPEYQYIGFITAEVCQIRNIQTSRGHGFTITHEPSEGKHHAHVNYRRADPDTKLTRPDKQELKLALRKCFGDLVKYKRG